MVVLGLTAAIPILAWSVRSLVQRPQRGVLLVAALAPFDGLLVLMEEPGLLVGWKEFLTVAVLVATALTAPHNRGSGGSVPSYVPPLLCLLAMAVAVSLWRPSVFVLVGLKVDFFYVLLAFALWRCPFSRQDRDQLVTILMATAVITAAIGLAQHALGAFGLRNLGYEFGESIRTTGDSVLRSFSTFVQPFPFAFFLVMVLAVCAPVALADPDRWRNRLFLAATPLLVLATLGTFVRAAVGALVMAAAYLHHRGHRRIWILAPLLVAGLVLAPPSLRGSTLSADSLAERVDGWAAVADEIVERPLGVGVGATGAAAELAVDRGSEVPETFDLPPDQQPYQPDNYYVKRLLELGLPGLWLTVLMLRHIVGSSIRQRRTADHHDAPFIDGVTGAVLGAILAATVANYWEIFPLDLYFWIMLGALTSIDRHGSPTADSPSNPAEAEFRPTLAAC